jgi:hypothetical protein
MGDAVNPMKRIELDSELMPGPTSDTGKLQSFGWMPCTLSLEIPITGFTLADLVHLTAGRIVESAWNDARDVPLRVNNILVAWAQFEADGDRMCALITDLA